MDMLRRMFEKKRPPAPKDLPHSIYIMLPEAIGPTERYDQYGDPIDAELQLTGLGCVSGGGTATGPEDADGIEKIYGCGVDVDTHDLNGARTLLRQHLPSLGCPIGTELQFQVDGVHRHDLFDGNHWALDLPVTVVDQRDDD